MTELSRARALKAVEGILERYVQVHAIVSGYREECSVLRAPVAS